MLQKATVDINNHNLVALEGFFDSVESLDPSLTSPHNAMPMAVSTDINERARTIVKNVQQFLVDSSMVNVTEQLFGNNAGVPSQVYQLGSTSPATLLGSLDASQMNLLLDACGVRPADRPRMARTLALTLAKYAVGGKPSDGMAMHQKAAERNTGAAVDHVALESFYSPSIVSAFNSPRLTMESFGVNIDGTFPEVATALAVPLINYHQSAADRMLPTVPVTTPTANYVSEWAEVFSLDDAVVTPKALLDLYFDPSAISNELRLIQPLYANNTDGELIANNVIAFGKQVNILRLALNSADPSNDRINHTDTVSDHVRLTDILFTLTDIGTPDLEPEASGYVAPATETFLLSVPLTVGMFGHHEGAAERRLLAPSEALRFTLTNTSVMSNTTVSSLLSAALADGEMLTITAWPTASIMLHNGDLTGSCTASLTATKAAGAVALSDDFAALFARLTITPTGYKLDARYSEENMRKSALIVRGRRRHVEFNLRGGRNVLYDAPLAQKEGDENDASALITATMRLGNDQTTLQSITDVIASVAAGLNGSAAAGFDWQPLCRQYVSGNRVRPTVFVDEFNPSTIERMRDSDRTGDIKQRWLSYLTGVTTYLIANSGIGKQLPQGVKPTFRVTCGQKVLGRLFGISHIYGHLDDGKYVDGEGGVEYRMTLADGTVLEIATTLFTEWEEAMVMTLFIPGAPTSDLNFGHILDYGTYFLSYAPSDGARGTHKRLAGNTRILPIPLCPVAALITLTAGSLDALSYIV